MQQIKYKGILIDYQLISHQKLQARKEWQDILKRMKGRNQHPGTRPSEALVQI